MASDPASPFPSSFSPSDISQIDAEIPEETDDFTMVEGTIQATDYARRCKELMALHASLTALGAGNLIDLPRIVVIGGQSAGKSSLVEAVSGVRSYHTGIDVKELTS
jgi:GTP-binding protein EngB required for normal cell division